MCMGLGCDSGVGKEKSMPDVVSIFKERKQEYLLYVAAFVAIGFVCCLNIRKLDYINIINDEFGYWMYAASAAGYDWKELISSTPYYSWGYSIWLIPIVVLLPTPKLWYKAAIFLNVFFLFIAFICCYKVGKRLFPKAGNLLVGVVSVIVILYPGNILQAQNAWSEILLVCCTWVATYLIISLEDDFSMMRFIAAVTVLVYMFAVHNRSIGSVAAGVLCLGLILLKHKKGIGHWIILIFGMLAGYLIVNQVKAYCLDLLWSNSTQSSLNNVSINAETIASYGSRITSQGLKMLESLGGKAFYLALGSALTLPLAVICVCRTLISNIRQKHLFDGYAVSKLWCCLALALQWGICALAANDWVGRKDLLVYGRYMENAIGPVLLLGIMYVVMENRQLVQKVLIITFAACIIGFYPVYYCVAHALGTFNVLCSPVVGAYVESLGDVRKAFIILGIALVGIFAVLEIALRMQSVRKRAAIMLTVIGAFYLITAFQEGKWLVNNRASIMRRSVPMAEMITEQYDGRSLYFIQNNEMDSYNMNPKYLQFIIPERTIHVINAEDVEALTGQEVVILANYEDETVEELLMEIPGVEKRETIGLLDLYAVN